MIAVLGGLGAAVCWSVGTLSAARASRLTGARIVLAWVMLIGLVVVAPLAAAGGIPAALGTRQIGWMAVSGAGNVGGLMLAYEAMRRGTVSIVAPITSTEGGIAALLAVATGETLHVSSAVLLAAVAVGVVLASIAPGSVGAHPLRASLLAACAACLFGASLFATARVGNALPLVWALLPPRLVGVAAVTLPSLAARRLGISRRALPYCALSGLCEVGGFAAYAVGARHGTAISAVLASQFAALTAIAAFFLFRERLSTVQIAGVGTIVVGVVVLSALQA